MTAVAYVRKSSAPGNGSVSFDMQVRETRQLAARHGDELPEVLSDMGVSGGSTRRRPNYQRLVEAIEAGETRTVYSYSLSRLARSVIDFGDLLERCRRRGVTVRLVQEGQIDYTTATGRAFANMAAVFAQMEREIAAERMSAAVAERRERGEAMGQAPYGFQIMDGQLVERPDEPLHAVVDAFREAGSFGATARLLNQRGVRTRHGRPWTHGVVSDVLRRTAPPDLTVPLLGKRSGAAPRGSAIFARLLLCRCGALLTPRKDVANPTGASGYYCSRSYRLPQRGRMHAPERPILEWAQAEAARLRLPDAVEIQTAGDEELRRRLEVRRSRVIDAYVDGVIDKVERDGRLRGIDGEADRIAVSTAVAKIPALDWSWPPAELNTALRALWEYVELDDALRPIRAVWRVPEWRS